MNGPVDRTPIMQSVPPKGRRPGADPTPDDRRDVGFATVEEDIATAERTNASLPGERRWSQNRRRPLRPMSIAFLLLAFGGLLTVLLPPVGVVLLLIGMVVFVWGLLSAARHSRAH